MNRFDLTRRRIIVNLNLKQVMSVARTAGVLAIAILAGLVLFTTASSVLGFRALVVTSSSMEPTLPTGSIVFIRQINRIRKNDIITYPFSFSEKTLVTHRVIEIVKKGNQEAYRVKGDAVQSLDDGLVKAQEVKGVVVFMIPFVGRIVAFAKTQLGLILLVVIPATLVAYEEFKVIMSQLGRIKSERSKPYA